MKITQENPGGLLLRDNNYSGFVGGIFSALLGGGLAYVTLTAGDAPFWAPLIGFVFVALGLWLVVSTKIVTINLARAGMCHFSTWSILSRQARDLPPSSIKGIRLDRFFERTKNKSYYQYSLVFLLDSGGELPFEFGRVNASMLDMVMSGPHDKKREEAKKVSDFLGVPLTEGGAPTPRDAINAVKDTIAGQMQKRDQV